jgi:hypothetical protein
MTQEQAEAHAVKNTWDNSSDEMLKFIVDNK